jgi:hypothetical protein
VQASEDPLYFAVIDKASGKTAGRQTFLRIEPAHGCMEIGHIQVLPDGTFPEPSEAGLITMGIELEVLVALQGVG